MVVSHPAAGPHKAAACTAVHEKGERGTLLPFPGSFSFHLEFLPRGVEVSVSFRVTPP